MADEKSTFPTMGDDWITSTFNNRSGASSSYTKTQPRKNTQSGDIPGVGTKADKSAVTMSGTNPGIGPHIQATICYPNSPEKAKVLRQVKPMSGSGFYGARGAAGNTGNV
jgi:hypothetical protein